MTVPVLAGLDQHGQPDARVAARVARAWLAGGLVGLPTETVYGLSAVASDADAVARVYAVKGRPLDHPVIVHVAGVEALSGWSPDPGPRAGVLAEAFWPGPLTVVVTRGPAAGDHLTGGQPTVALRCPGHPVARACLRALAELTGDPAAGVAAPSANRFGRVSPTAAADVVAELGGLLDPARDLVVDAGRSEVGVESTIVDATGPHPQVLRQGAISQEQVDAVLAAAGLLDRDSAGGPDAAAPPDAHSAGAPARAGDVRAPGGLASHYAPRARVRLLEPVAAADPVRLTAVGAGTVGLLAAASVATPPGWTRLAAPRTAQEFAHGLYRALRRADDLGLDTVVAVLPDPAGGSLAEAVRDRLTRAAHEG